MDLKSLLVDSKTTWVEFPGLLGFEVELANLSRKELTGLRKKCTVNKFNRKTINFTLHDNTVYAFGNEVNVRFRHGIPQLDGEINEPRVSIIVWVYSNYLK